MVSATSEASDAQAVVSQPALTAQAAEAIVAESVPTPEEKTSEEEKAPESAPRQKVAVPAGEPVAEVHAESVAASVPKKKKKKKKKVAKKLASATTESVLAPHSAPEAQSREVLHDKLDRLEQRLEEKKEEVARAAREGFASDPALDDTSVPPIDLDVHDEFFAAGDRPQQKIPGASGSFEAIDPKALRKMTAEARARRAHLSRYVKWAVGGAAVLLLLGFVVKMVRGKASDEPVVRQEVVHVAQAAPVPPPAVEERAENKAQQAPVDQGELDEQPKADEAKVDDKKADEDKKVENADTDKKDEPLVDKPKTAWQEKQAAKAALEGGANGAAVAAGERSVALDPSDGEAWLVLGAAYQALGNGGQAKRAYNACINQGKKGPIDECRQMLGSM